MVTRSRFPPGIALESHKRAEWVAPVIELPTPTRVVLAMDSGTGVAAEPMVGVGESVARGRLIGRASSPFATNVHASIPGVVVAVQSRDASVPTGRCTCITIEGGHDAVPPASTFAAPDHSAMDPAALTRALHEAGLAGLGGAGFPTATKLASGRDKAVHMLILNGAECEPWISCDDALMQSAADEVVFGSALLRRACGATRCIIAIEDDKPAAIAAITRAIEATHDDDAVSLNIVPAVYPQGAERQLIATIMGVEPPSGGLPVDVGIICQNVATAAAAARWARSGEPLLSRIVTVTGSGVVQPCNVRAPLGTPLAELIAAAGGYRDTPLRLIAGGNMTGLALPSDDVGLGKATHCVFVATRHDIGPRLSAREVPCIRCGNCSDVCPAGLLPQQLHRVALADQHDALRQLGVFDCIDCGLCDYVCPSQIPLAHRFRLARDRLRKADLQAQKAEAARERYEQRERRLHEAAAREQREFEDIRNHARAGNDGDPGEGPRTRGG